MSVYNILIVGDDIVCVPSVVSQVHIPEIVVLGLRHSNEGRNRVSAECAVLYILFVESRAAYR
jgi:hypothetical protein